MYKVHNLSLTARQIKAARALLDWSQEDLAQASQLSIATIRKLELGFISPRDQTMNAIHEAFEHVGIDFTNDGGVRVKQHEVTILRSLEGIHAFFDDVYRSVRQKGGEILQICPSEAPYVVPYGDTCSVHFERMTKIKDTYSAKCLLTEDKNTYCGAYSEYRFLPKDFIEVAPYYVYDDKYAIFDFDVPPAPEIIVIKSHKIAESYRRQFHSLWAKAIPLKVPETPDFLRSAIKQSA